MGIRKKNPDYRALFIIGITFLGAGVAISTASGWPAGVGLIGVGVVFEVIALKHRDQWKR